MGQRVANERQPAQHDEAADQAAEHTDDRYLEHRTLEEAVLPRLGEQLDHENTAICPPKVARIVSGVYVVAVGPKATSR